MAGVKTSKGGPSIYRERFLDGKLVVPTKYYGKSGKYMSGRVDNELVLDYNGKPKHLRDIGELGPIQIRGQNRR